MHFEHGVLVDTCSTEANLYSLLVPLSYANDTMYSFYHTHQQDERRCLQET